MGAADHGSSQHGDLGGTDLAIGTGVSLGAIWMKSPVKSCEIHKSEYVITMKNHVDTCNMYRLLPPLSM